jgi:transcriptional regulator with XRE-family HTH domain
VNGAKLARLRRAKGWSQQRLAVEAGVHAMTVSAAEREAKEPLLDTVEALARALGVTVDDLLEPEPEEATA